MLHAVEAPLLKFAAVAGALAAGAFFIAPKHEHGLVQRLELHAPQPTSPSTIYLTAWDHGDVYVTLPDGKPRAMTFRTHAYVTDERALGSCEVVSTEHIVPDGPNRYAYSYDEQILACEPGAPTLIKTPRVGYATVVNTFNR